MTPLKAGSVVTLNGAETFGEDGDRSLLFGLYVLVGHEDADPAAFIAESGWLIEEALTTPACNKDAPSIFITDWELWEQTDPKGYGRFLAEERACELASEDEVRV